ncbi:hypothetical protein CPB85DRAFT_1430939 [Mucidula mucida]|nr:hypothetical protein CPB85DRAFT_1430939 [Mucidula mucida]
MAASGADIRSILSIPQASTSKGPATKKPPPQRAKKPEGISRELYSLIGPSAPSIVAQLQKPRLKQKPRLNSGAIKWEWRNFKNRGRTDSLQLGHWIKASTPPDADYPFAKYDLHLADYSYTQEEYSRTLEDAEWTKEETDYLFTVVRQYDQRWYVIYDRYHYPGGQTRSLEDLKERYCNVCRRLIKDRPWTGDTSTKNTLLASFSFDKEREITRKRYLANLENRTAREAEEEEALYLEIKRIEQNERRFKRDREDLLRTLAGIESGLPDIVEDEFPTILFENKKKKNKSGLDTDSPSTPVPPSASISAAPPPKRPIVNPKVPPPDPAQCITHIELSPTTPATKAAHQPSYLRSFKLPNPKANILPKVMQTLSEIGMSYNRLVMPTEGNVKVLDKTEYDIKVLKERLGMRESTVVEGDDSASVADGASDIVMLDEGAVDELGRSQSVVSTRSTRSRKQRGRSLSVSSVDTSVSRAPKRRRN